MTTARQDLRNHLRAEHGAPPVTEDRQASHAQLAAWHSEAHHHRASGHTSHRNLPPDFLRPPGDQRLPRRDGFAFERVRVVQVTCLRCGEWELTHGEDPSARAAWWAARHACESAR